MTGANDAPRTDLLHLAGSTLVVGITGPHLTPDEAVRLRQIGPGGVILFARNVESASQVRRLTDAIHDLLDEPLVLLDQEGGRVDRLRSLAGPGPSPRLTARRGGEVAVLALAEDTAGALRALGITMNCAPVIDLDEDHDANGLGDRCLGRDGGEVARMARHVLQAHAAAGVLTCLKHFPGLGRTLSDTHFALPSVDYTREELVERELVPFRLLADHAPAVMVSHGAYPAATGTDDPASLSAVMIARLLRRDLGFDGLVLTDDLDMAAVAAWSPGERAARALAAGADLLLSCSSLDSAEASVTAILEAVRRGGLDERCLHAAASRLRIARRQIHRAHASSPAEAEAVIAASRSVRADWLRRLG